MTRIKNSYGPTDLAGGFKILSNKYKKHPVCVCLSLMLNSGSPEGRLMFKEILKSRICKRSLLKVLKIHIVKTLFFYFLELLTALVTLLLSFYLSSQWSKSTLNCLTSTET